MALPMSGFETLIHNGVVLENEEKCSLLKWPRLDRFPDIRCSPSLLDGFVRYDIGEQGVHIEVMLHYEVNACKCSRRRLVQNSDNFTF